MSTERITIDASLFAPVPEAGPDVEMTSVVIRSDQPDLAAHALARAALRFQYVDENGHEMLDDDEADANDELESPRQTPNFTSPVIRTPEGPEIYSDFKGPFTPEMKPTLARIVSEELTAIGVHDATLMSISQPDRRREPWFDTPDDTGMPGPIIVRFSLFWPAWEDSREGTEINVFVASENPEASARALTRAAQRFTRLSVNGTEPENADTPRGQGTFEQIGQLHRNPLGPYVSMDRGAYLPTAMGQAMVRILREELRAAGVHEATLSSGGTYGRTELWVDAQPAD